MEFNQVYQYPFNGNLRKERAKEQEINILKKNGNFPVGLVVKTLPSNAGALGSIPGWGAGIPHALQSKKPQNIKQKHYCNRLTLKMAHITPAPTSPLLSLGTSPTEACSH